MLVLICLFNIWLRCGWLLEPIAPAISSRDVLADLDFLLGCLRDSLRDIMGPMETLRRNSGMLTGFRECRLPPFCGSTDADCDNCDMSPESTDSEAW